MKTSFRTAAAAGHLVPSEKRPPRQLLEPRRTEMVDFKHRYSRALYRKGGNDE